MLVREKGLCGKGAKLLKRRRASAAECAALAQAKKFTSFALGSGRRWFRGRCWGMKLEVKADMIKAFKKDRVKPKCPLGKWRKSRLYDFYAILPPKKV